MSSVVSAKFQEKLRNLLVVLARYDRSNQYSADEPKIQEGEGGFGIVYQTYMQIDGLRVKVALKELLFKESADFTKVWRDFVCKTSAVYPPP